MADIQDLIGAIVNKDALSVKSIFEEVIAEKIGERMDFLRPLVAESMFNEGKMKCDECGYGMAKEDSNCKKCGCSMNEDYDWDSLVSESLAEDVESIDELSPGFLRKAAGEAGSRGQEHYYSAGSASDRDPETADTHRKIGAAYWKQRDRLEAGAKKREKAAAAPTAGVGAGKLARLNKEESDDSVKDDAPDTVAKDHPLVQLKKILDTKGGAFRTSTGKTVHVDHASAKRLLALHNATQKSEVKQKFASAVHRDPIGTHDRFFPKAKIGEETELDELSNRTLGRYATRAAQSGDTAIRMSNTDDDSMGKIANKRFAGVKLATRKMAARTGDKATATRVAKNLDKAKIAGQGASTLSNKDREDSGKAHYAAMRGIDKLRGESFENEETELDERNAENKVKKMGWEVKRGLGIMARTERKAGSKNAMKDIRTGVQNDLYHDTSRQLQHIAANAKKSSRTGSSTGGMYRPYRLEETELDERNAANKVKKIGWEVRRGHEMVKKAAGGAISVTGPDGRQTGHDHRLIKRTSRANNEETELDELSQDTLVSYGQKAREAGGRTKGSALAVKKILAARGKSTGVKVPASEETE